MKPQQQSNTINKSELRKTLRSNRRQLSPQEQQAASLGLLQQTKTLDVFIRAKHLAFYLASDGELSPHEVMSYAQSLGKTCYLPVIHPIHPRQLWFVPYRIGDQLEPNRFGILEPRIKKGRFHRPAFSLDVVFTPLVGFDENKNRMGMGGGFYDRTFHFLFNGIRKPRMVGVAHECQKVSRLPIESWDIPMTAIITDQNKYL